MKELGVNTIRTYHVDPKGNHKACMQAFADAGIYVLLDLDTFSTYIDIVRFKFHTIATFSTNTNDGQNHVYWNDTQFDAYAKVMDKFQGFSNILGFFIGNENIATAEQTKLAPYLKAAARDMKAYRDKMQYRKIPVGYSAVHIVEVQPMLQDFLTCGGKDEDIVDFYAINSYSWCGDSTYEASNYKILNQYADNFPVPVFFSETGCIAARPRTFSDQDAIFSKPMVDNFSGALIYEWIQEQNDYGLVTYGKADPAANNADAFDGFNRKGEPTPVAPDFENLKSKWATITPTGVSKSDYTPHASTRDCPKPTGWWQIDGNVELPVVGQDFKGKPGPTQTGSSRSRSSSSPSASAKPSDTTKPDGGSDSKSGNSGTNDKQSAAPVSPSNKLAATGAAFAAVLAATLLL